MKDCRIAVAGTGYVGLSIATLLSQHHHVTAVDVIPEKVKMLSRRKSPIQDEYIEKYLAEKPLDKGCLTTARTASSLALTQMVSTVRGAYEDDANVNLYIPVPYYGKNISGKVVRVIQSHIEEVNKRLVESLNKINKLIIQHSYILLLYSKITLFINAKQRFT